MRHGARRRTRLLGWSGVLPHACQLLTCPRCPPAAPPTHTYHEQGTDKKGNPIQYDLEGPINFSVFPGLQVRCARCARCAVLPPTQSAAEWIRALQYHAMRCNVSRPRLTPAARCPAPHDAQGGPHNHTISGLACALKQAATPEFKAYQQQVRRACRPPPSLPSPAQASLHDRCILLVASPCWCEAACAWPVLNLPPCCLPRPPARPPTRPPARRCCATRKRWPRACSTAATPWSAAAPTTTSC